MSELIHIIRRHEKTARGSDGKKLDQPTHEGFARAYEEGMALPEAYPGYVINASHSDKERTFIAAGATLMGAGVAPLYSHLSYSPSLDSALEQGDLDPALKEKLRAIKDPEEMMRVLFTEYAALVKGAGIAIADRVIAGADTYIRNGGADALQLDVTHGGALDAAALIVMGIPVTYEAGREQGWFHEGEGMRIVAHQGSPVVSVEKLALSDGTYSLVKPVSVQKYDLADMQRHLEQAKAE